MTIYYSDEDGRLTEEIKTLMEAAAAKAIELEFDSELRDADMDASEVDAEVSVTVVSGDEIRELKGQCNGCPQLSSVR